MAVVVGQLGAGGYACSEPRANHPHPVPHLKPDGFQSASGYAEAARTWKQATVTAAAHHRGWHDRPLHYSRIFRCAVAAHRTTGGREHAVQAAHFPAVVPEHAHRAHPSPSDLSEHALPAAHDPSRERGLSTSGASSGLYQRGRKGLHPGRGMKSKEGPRTAGMWGAQRRWPPEPGWSPAKGWLGGGRGEPCQVALAQFVP